MTELQSKLYRLNLQFFASDDNQDDNSNTDDDNQDDNNSNDDNTNDDNQDDLTFTKSDVDSAISKAVNTALKNQATKLEKEKQQAIEDARKDAANYAKMTKQQQEEADYQKRVKDLEDRERELNLKQLRTEVEGDLKEEGLPTDFADSLVTLDDNEKIKESISNIKKTFDEAVNNAVKEKLRQDPPENGQSFKGGQNTHKSKAEMAKKARII